MRHLASRQSLESTVEILLASTASLDDTGLGALGQDLNAVAGLIAQEPSLRRTLSDNTIDKAAKAGLVDQLLRGKVGEPARKVLDKVVQAEWSTGTDLIDALHYLGRTAMFLRTERAGELDEVEDEIFRFGRIIDANPSLGIALDDPAATAAARGKLIRQLLSGKAHELTVELLIAVAADTRGRPFSHGVDELVEQAAERKDKAVAVVTSPVELSSSQYSRLVAALAQIYRRPVAVHVQVNPSIQGGLVVRVGDEVIDGSVAGRIAAVKAKLAG